MGVIQILDPKTIDKIAAGEVIERPASIVKELVENSIDAGAQRITVEIKEGGISYIRVADDGCGMQREDLRTAFLRHATSKLRSADELSSIRSLGFRGEALSSIAAVSRTEVVTKTSAEDAASMYHIDGGVEQSLSDTAAREGTTFIVRQLFYNVPARKKFLKTANTEAAHVHDVMIRQALSHPDIAFSFISQGKQRIETAGNGNAADVIYRIFGRDTARDMIKVDIKSGGMRLYGHIGRPETTRSNRNYEFFFVNDRYIKSTLLSKALEEGYREYAMQHKFPFAVLHLLMDGEGVDVNVHPTKMEVRFQNTGDVFNFIRRSVAEAMSKPSLIPSVTLDQKQSEQSGQVNTNRYTVNKDVGCVEEPKGKYNQDRFPKKDEAEYAPLKFTGVECEGRESTEEAAEKNVVAPPLNPDHDYFMQKMRERVTAYHNRRSCAEIAGKETLLSEKSQTDIIREHSRQARESGEQISFFRDEKAPSYTIIGQLFSTYWLLQAGEQLYIVDQHAAHEKVLYERTVKSLREKEYGSQYISPPLVIHVTMREKNALETYMDEFTRIGFELEPFGEDAYSVRAVPSNLFGLAHRDIFMEMLDELDDELRMNRAGDSVLDKIASISCKAAVKGNHAMSRPELKALMDELLLLDNPFHCPHGRPTIITISKRELEKKFKRIV